MKKIIMSFALMLACGAIANAQTTATNWTAQDCASTSHTLFTELDNGKVVIMVWVMPCNSCVSGAKAAFSAYQALEASNPGKVLFYLADDIGDANCTQLTSWINSNNIGDVSKMTLFSNDGNTINESDLGGSGMPHIAVMAGKDHKIYFNKKNAAANDPTGIQNAAKYAINVTTGVNDINSQLKFSVAPNPAKDRLSISFKNAIEKIVITSITGQVVREESFSNGKENPTISLNGIAPGIYSLKVNDLNGSSGIQKIVIE